ncbi:MAG: hydratase [Pseudomonadota bacterium]
MTERTGDRVARARNQFTLGPSRLDWSGGRLTIHVDETCAPVPRALKGTITVDTRHVGEQAFPLDDGGRHHWRPVDPGAAVSVVFDRPGLSWAGRGYLDMNWGSEPLEAGFRFWDWSRFDLGDGGAAILYRTDPRQGERRELALRFRPDGSHEAFTASDAGELARTRYWRIRRPALAEGGGAVRLVRTFEDTPFYSRSEVSADLFGRVCRGVHESFDGDRLKLNMVRALLPVRMPRRR